MTRIRTVHTVHTLDKNAEAHHITDSKSHGRSVCGMRCVGYVCIVLKFVTRENPLVSGGGEKKTSVSLSCSRARVNLHVRRLTNANLDSTDVKSYNPHGLLHLYIRNILKPYRERLVEPLWSLFSEARPHDGSLGQGLGTPSRTFR